MATAAAGAAPVSAMPSSASGASAGGADPDPSTQPYHFPPESIRVYAETLNTALGEEVAKEMAEDMTFRRVYPQIAVLRNGNMNATISLQIAETDTGLAAVHVPRQEVEAARGGHRPGAAGGGPGAHLRHDGRTGIHSLQGTSVH